MKNRVEDALVVGFRAEAHLPGGQIRTKVVPVVQPDGIGICCLKCLMRVKHGGNVTYEAQQLITRRIVRVIANNTDTDEIPLRH
jgi:hypothetical protein